MLPEQSDFTSQSISQLQVPSSQMPWELQSLSIKQTNAKKIMIIKSKYSYSNNWKILIHLDLNFVEHFKSWSVQDIKFFPLSFDAVLTLTISK